jgi:hypothetical protein
MIDESDQVIIRKASDTVVDLVEKGRASDYYATYN